MSLAERKQRENLMEIYIEVDKEVNTLPYHIKAELTKKVNKEVMDDFFPMQHEPALLYWE